MLNKPNFLFSSPTLDLLFTCDCVANVLKTFVPNETVALIHRGKTGDLSISMLLDSTTETVSYPAVENVRSTGYDIYVVVMFSLAHSGLLLYLK